MKISVLNGQRARALFDAGYQTMADISKANVLSIEKCLVDSISFDVQKRDGETNYDADQRNKQRLLFVTGRAGLTVKEAAQLIIDEARDYLRSEMGIQNVNWSMIQNEAKNDDANPDATEEHTVNGGNAIAEENAHGNDTSRPQANKRRIPLDEELVTPNKRRSRGPWNGNDAIASDEPSSDGSDVDSIIFDTSTSLYNDEHEDFLEQLRPKSDAPILENEVHGMAPRLEIIDVTKSLAEFNHFVKTIANVSRCGFSLAMARLDASTPLHRYNCVISPELYLYGLAFSLQNKYVVHFLTLQNDGNQIDFNEKINFIQNLLGKASFTLQINDAKTQLKTLSLAIPGIDRVGCSIEDPQVAQWLIQPEDNRTFSKLVGPILLELI